MSKLTVKDVKISEMTKSDYIKPIRVNYVQDGKSKIWDLVEVHHSVAAIIYNKERKRLICVKQFRPGVYYHSTAQNDRTNEIDTSKYPSSLGETVEFCSGIVDKNKSLKEIAVEEIEEETGYVVSQQNLEEVKTFRSAVGIAGDSTTMYYVEVTDNQKKSSGGGIDEEIIEVVELTIEEAQELLRQPVTTAPAEFLFGLLWFLQNKKN
ncbi:hypothetical protein O3M35_004684 [Rhynocoris fuscipes]|uniref:Uridine diphosphate glucose pyrophosphatase NUDT14 n=1 Tax=Rhynocoris fuscipes TaxID=488301 RepID=A0AAW1CG86_9HEMI